MRTALLLIFLAVSARGAETIELTHGRWFDGTRFVNGTWYVANGVLTKARPAHIERTIDLRDGIFYVKNPNNLPRGTAIRH